MRGEIGVRPVGRGAESGVGGGMIFGCVIAPAGGARVLIPAVGVAVHSGVELPATVRPALLIIALR